MEVEMSYRNFGRSVLTALPCLALLAGCASSPKGPDFYGSPTVVSQANRTIAIRPDTKWVNAEGGETLNFATPTGTFAWHFFAIVPRQFELDFVAPAGMLDHQVVAFIETDPLYKDCGC
jgi:hypothetical protein